MLVLLYTKLNTSKFKAFIGDNFLNSYRSLIPLNLEAGYSSKISIVNTDIEKKLPQPHNPCTDPADKTYRQANCIELCLSEKIAHKHNCSIQSFYRVDGLQSCGTTFYASMPYLVYDADYVANLTSDRDG